ncbi:hypothetical protein C8F04DRAFT_1185291 [Mycena alexandri]|uniref:Uncharacterized protein n=1 Tax=Mycena alexandri TaxID=1745969 RepID=A0AAD6SQQ2_9AGAR|nr:hypothetical protein C8F04DRAFT_1185291 [Mycena alexandri]
MVRISAQETRRLHGPRNHPHYKANVRQRAIIRKVAELFTDQQLRIFFGEYHGVSNICYDAYHMKHGNDYAVRNPAAKTGLQDAEQEWHDSVVRYRLERGMGDRPEWAMQPLPGLRRVNIAFAPALIAAPGPAPPLTPVATPRGRWGLAQFAPLPTPPASSPASSPSPASPPSSSPVCSSSPVHIDLSHVDDNDELARRTQKRKFLGIVEISDDDEEELRPRKKMRYLGHLDLTI